MAGEGWKVDIENLTLDDLILISEFAQGLTNEELIQQVKPLKELLGRLVVDKTEEEIGRLTLQELNELCGGIGKAVEEAALPKETESASKTS